MNYAILPTVSDIMTVADIYNGILSRKASRFLVLKTQGDYERTYAPTSSLVTGADEKHSFRARAVYSIDDAVLAGLSLIGLTDVPGTAVELMRWSWIVDWLVPVSSWASSITPTIGMNLVDAFVGARVVEDHHQAKRSFRPSGCPAANAKPYTIDPLRLEGSWRKKIEVRAHLVAKNPFSMSHLATTAAVIRQLS